MITLRTEIQIQAASEKVWQILTDLAKYPEWNPFITQAIGRVEVGARVEITVPSASKEMKLHCTVIKAEPRQVLCWKYHVISPFYSGVSTVSPLSQWEAIMSVSLTRKYSMVCSFRCKPKILIQIPGRVLKQWIKRSS
jgi:uncharacterized protein YndB with AHSA1/START domain